MPKKAPGTFFERGAPHKLPCRSNAYLPPHKLALLVQETTSLHHTTKRGDRNRAWAVFAARVSLQSQAAAEQWRPWTSASYATS